MGSDFDGQYRFDNPNNSSISLRNLAELARRGEVKVVQDGVDGVGRMVLRFELPGSRTVRKPPASSRR